MSERADDPAGDVVAAAGSGARETDLLQRYQALVAKYERAVQKQRLGARKYCAIFRFLWWALQRSTQAPALVSRRSVLVSNAHWRQLQEGGGRWTPSGASGHGRSLGLV